MPEGVEGLLPPLPLFGKETETESEKKRSKKKTMDVLAHILNPKMDILPENEKEKVLKKFSVNEDQLPVMRHNDPAAVALGAKPGDLIRVNRKEETGEYTSYRIVV